MINELEQLLRQRHSCRAFRPDPIPRATIERILSTAQKVPSWCNAQPWQVILTSAEETDRLRPALFAEAASAPHTPDVTFPAQYTGDYKARRSECGWALYDAVGIAKGDREASRAQMMENFNLFGAPHLALITSEADLGAYGLLDCGAYVTAFTLAAEALGVASIPQAALAGVAPFLRKWFEIPENRHIICAISFGLSHTEHDANQFRTSRAPLADVVKWVG